MLQANNTLLYQIKKENAIGKGATFTRPGIVVKKYNHHTFSGLPLTTRGSDSHLYFEFEFLNRQQFVNLSQLRLFDSKRLNNKMGQLSEKKFEEIKKALQKGLNL